MARVYGIRKRLAEQDIDAGLAKQIIGSGDLVEITVRMERLLDPETTHAILDSCACGTGRGELNALKEIEGDTLQEKIGRIARLPDFHADWDVSLSPDNTLRAGWAIQGNDAYACVCSAAVNRTAKVSDLTHSGRAMPLIYCFCCAGHCRRHLEELLRIRLKTRAVVSSPLSSSGEKPCAFVFEIVSA